MRRRKCRSILSLPGLRRQAAGADGRFVGSPAILAREVFLACGLLGACAAGRWRNRVLGADEHGLAERSIRRCRDLFELAKRSGQGRGRHAALAVKMVVGGACACACSRTGRNICAHISPGTRAEKYSPNTLRALRGIGVYGWRHLSIHVYPL